MSPPNLSCHFRTRIQREGAVEVAECLLLREITGVVDSTLCRVGSEACLYCSRLGESSIHQVNSVVGSLLFGLTTEILEQGGVAGCNAAKADQIRCWAEDFLDNAPDEVVDLDRPARADLPCHNFGDELDPLALVNSGHLGSEPVFRCHHPAHLETTRAGCIRCRDWSDRPRPAAPPIEEWLPAPARRTGGPVRRWAVGLTTAPRRKPTLEWTLDSLVRAGWDQARLFVDAAVTIPRRYAHLPVTQRQPKSGAWPNFYLGLTELLMREPEADAYLMVQDDVTFYDRINLREYLESILWPEDPAPPISLYSCQLDVAAQAGWHPHDKPWFRGAHAFIFHPATVRQFLVDPIVFGHRWNPRNDGLAHVDTVVGDWAHRNGTPVLLPTPSLCRHTGRTSTLWPEARIEHDRKEGAFGDEALRLTPRGLFPEAAFACPESNLANYLATIERGRARIRQQSVTICGIGRDIERNFPEFAARVERLGAMFQTYHAVFFENDSNDRTPTLLRDWAEANPAIRVVSEQRGDPRFGSIRSLTRATALASYRNRCRDLVLAEFADDDHVIVVDMDLEGGWSEDGIAHTFGLDHWDFVGSYGLRHEPASPLDRGRDRERKPIHLDIWAYRLPGTEEPVPNQQAQELALRRGDPLHPVGSCFGGLGIYRMECLKAASYGGDDCEHVVFHRRLRQLGFDRLYLNPSQIVLYKALEPADIAIERPR